MAGDGGVKLDHLPRFLVFINVLPYIYWLTFHFYRSQKPLYLQFLSQNEYVTSQSYMLILLFPSCQFLLKQKKTHRYFILLTLLEYIY